MLSHTEENHIKAVYHLSTEGRASVSTTELAARMNTTPASITDMIKRLSTKKLLTYERYHGVRITMEGQRTALRIIRRHRLWETFLVNKLGFTWDQVHDVAEQLEHVQSSQLVDKLDDFLGNPVTDPHGHWIPDRDGNITAPERLPLSTAPLNQHLQLQSIGDQNPAVLQYLSRIGVYIGAEVMITERRSFDGSMEVLIDNKENVTLSREVGQQLFVHA